jgi:hypothetical protein
LENINWQFIFVPIERHAFHDVFRRGEVVLDWFLEACGKDVLGEMVGFGGRKGEGSHF